MKVLTRKATIVIAICTWGLVACTGEGSGGGGIDSGLSDAAGDAILSSDADLDGDEVGDGTVNDDGSLTPQCPDGICNGTETCSSCAQDCGACCTPSCVGKRCGDSDGCSGICFQGSDCRNGACGCGNPSEYGQGSNRWVCNATAAANERCQLNCPYGNIGCFSSWYFSNTAYSSTNGDDACKAECPSRCSTTAEYCCLCDRFETCSASCN